MKKKIFTLTALAFCSFIASCNNNVYTINLDDMENIISLVDVKYLQTQTSISGSGSGAESGLEQMSPTAYYQNSSGDIINFEKYVYYDDQNKLMQMWRYEGSWSTPEEALESDFITPQKRGEGIKSHYSMAKNKGSTFTYDKDKLCYCTSFSSTTKEYTISEDIEFYFCNNKLVKFIYRQSLDENSNISISEIHTMELTYKEITPSFPNVTKI